MDIIRTMHSQYPFGCNDRIDSLQDKWKYNCEFAKFVSPKPKRQRSWSITCISNSDATSEPYVSAIVDERLTLLRSDYHSDYISVVKRLIFPLCKNFLMEIRRYYLEKVFTDDELKIISLHKQFHHIVIDLLEYKIRPFNSSNKNKQTLLKKNRVLFKLENGACVQEALGYGFNRCQC